MESCTNMNYRDVTNLKTYAMSVEGNATKTVVKVLCKSDSERRY